MNNNISSEQKFLENYKKRITKEVIKCLCKDYKIYDSYDNLMDSEILQKLLLTPKVIRRCIGTTNTSPITQCSRNALENCDYCKTHMYKLGITNKDNFNPNILFEYKYTNNDENGDSEKVHNKVYEKDLKKKFIDDVFYLIDDKFIYDNKTLEKVGIINNNNYILTLDPFILKTL